MKISVCRLGRLAPAIWLIITLTVVWGGTFPVGKIDDRPATHGFSGLLESGSPPDSYIFALGSECDVSIELSKLTANADLTIRTSGGAVIGQSANPQKKKEILSLRLAPGDYGAVVSSADGKKAKYKLSLSASFVPNDVVVSETLEMQDPEFDAASLKVAWRDGTRLYVASIDSETGFFDLANRSLLDDHIAPDTDVLNGPEWACAGEGRSRLLYSVNENGQWGIRQAWQLPDDRWETAAIPGTAGGYKPIGSQDETAAALLMKYEIGVPGGPSQGQAWKALDPPHDGDALPAGTVSGRFAPGNSAIVYSRAVGKFLQVVWYDLATKTERVLTTGRTHKILPFAFSAPEFGGETLITIPETTDITERGAFPIRRRLP